MLGGMEGMRYKMHSLQLGEGDSIYLYTDGVTEAMNAAGTLYGEEKLQNCLKYMHGADPQAVLDRVHWSISEHVNGSEQFDDITMLCLKRTEQKEDAQ